MAFMTLPAKPPRQRGIERMFGLLLDPVLQGPFMTAGILLNLPPVFDVAFVMALGLRGSKSRGVVASLGISLGSLLHTVLATMGIVVLLYSHLWTYDALRYLGAAYLVVLAWFAWVGASAKLSALGAKGIRRAVAQEIVAKILNLKVALFTLALFP